MYCCFEDLEYFLRFLYEIDLLLCNKGDLDSCNVCMEIDESK